MGKSKIDIQMLGGFRISSDTGFVEEGSKSAPKFWKALQYLIAFRHKSITPDELISVVWPEDDEGNHKNAMHNMIHRIRSELQTHCLDMENEMIIFSGGGYCWNNALDCSVDCEEFEKLYNRACIEDIQEQEKLDLLLQSIELYKGEFLPNASAEMWAIPISSYYGSIYIRCVHLVLDLLIERGQYAQIEMICKKALLIDQFDVKINEHHLLAIIRQGNHAAALSEYQRVCALFYESLGVDPPEQLLALYTEIQRLGNSSERALEELMREWGESADFPGAYLCEYGMFKTVYQIEVRAISRSGKSIYVLSISVREEIKNQPKAMLRLRDIIQASLRKGDLFARAAPNQYVLMMQSLTYEDCKMLIKRIARKYEKGSSHFHPLKIKIRPLVPIK